VTRRLLLLTVALLLAGLAGVGAWWFLTGVEDDIRAGTEVVTVYRTVDAIEPGTPGDLLISQNRWALGETERQNVPDNAIPEGSLVDALQGKLAAGPISGNQILTTDQFVDVAAGVKPLSELITEGKQAMTIRVDDERGVNGFVEPGDRVNILVTTEVDLLFGGPFGRVLDQPQPTGEDEVVATADDERTVSRVVSRFVLQGISVLAVGRELRPADDAPQEVALMPAENAEVEVEPVQLVTLEVDADQAERLAYALERGSVWLTLVPEELVDVPSDGVTLENLFDDLGILGDVFDLENP
jgi:pilus assembly protein CpaB